MKDPLPEPSWEQEAEALLDEVFARLEEPLPSQRQALPPVPETLAITPVQPAPGNAVVLAYRPQPPAPTDTILTAAFVDDPPERNLPWWLWLGLGLVVMLGTWGWQRAWQVKSLPTALPPEHEEFIAYLDKALDHIPETPPRPRPQSPPAVTKTLPPPPPPVTVATIPQPPVVATPVVVPSPSPVARPVTPAPAAGPRPTLVGLLQMGPQSVAMFQIGETTQNVAIGETIGSSQWQLREVREREVVLVKGSQNRILLVGQTIPD
ncbi:MAG: hypothetical protein NZL92_09930 [Gloeomargarita sp. SKYG116]|nr:hypothetical protein [Gloeomargarita sp. SKYG116]MCS7225664.1 hypothetical protein [Gloeomargarita sp. SKYB31]MDW8402000.1 hypothetical protein [Gloeomargarita sp. SKYGB_i_bin116]